ncbi:MAG: hypothetical protein JKY86_12645 [Gammaproteobacteria bacterium]|nr:hypothetical protein [Gammaproteobacteria bacterium]
MKCAIHPSVETEVACSQCNTPLCEDCNVGSSEANAICSRCSALTAATDFEADQLSREKVLEEKLKAKEKKSSSSRHAQIALIIVALIIVPIQLLSLSSNTIPEPAINRNDPIEVTEECILNLLIIADLLQEGEVPATDFTCPASNDPYIITYTDNDVIVEDPHPELHGYSQMSVSKNNPFPEIIE